jgi:CheY-like chemotaxis protein
MKGDQYLVIFVDDSASAREVVEDGFRDTGYLLKTAAGVVELENRVLSSKENLKQVDMFIFDFDMPYLTGTQIASAMDKVYSELKNVPFLIFSGRPQEEVLKAIESAKKNSPTFAKNYRGYVPKKGDSVTELLATIGKILKK